MEIGRIRIKSRWIVEFANENNVIRANNPCYETGYLEIGELIEKEATTMTVVQIGSTFTFRALHTLAKI